MPPLVRPKTSRNLRLEDIDRGIKAWFERYAAPEVSTPAGERRKVAVLFASGERWVAASDQRGIRDRDGRLILPVISIRRTGIDAVNNMTALGANVPRLQIARLIADKTAYLSNNDVGTGNPMGRPLSHRRLRSQAVYDIYTIPFPFTSTLHYQAIVQAQYTHQMNEVIEKIVSELEFFDVPSFVVDVEYGFDPEKPIHDGQGPSELSAPQHAEFEDRARLDSYYVVGYFDAEFGDSGNLEEFTDQERIVELKLTFHVPVALMLDPSGNRPAVQKVQTAFTFSPGRETAITVDDPRELDLIFGRRK